MGPILNRLPMDKKLPRIRAVKFATAKMLIVLVFVAGCTSSPASDAAPTVEGLFPTPTSGSDILPTGLPDQVVTPSPAPSANIPNTPTTALMPTHTVEATVPPSPTATLTPEISGHQLPPDRDLYELARSLVLKTDAPIPRPVAGPLVTYEVGDEHSFTVVDLADQRTYIAEASLVLVSPHAYWYVEKGLNIPQENLDVAAAVFEERIYPEVTANLGSEWTPGIDNDIHLTILHAKLRGGVGGYFSSVDEYPKAVNKSSNEREMVYLNASGSYVGTPRYLSVLAHELQHAIHWNGDPTEETWVGEGLSELAAKLAGYDPGSEEVFLRNPATSLINWTSLPNSAHYGAAYLFFRYLADRSDFQVQLKRLVQDPGDGILGIDSHLRAINSGATFHDVFKDWVVANLLDEPGDGPYSYPNDGVGVRNVKKLRSNDDVRSTVPQYAAEYFFIDDVDEGLLVRFEGQAETPMLPTQFPGDSCWWGNRGDSISSTLTRDLDLTQVEDATLSFRVWHEIEEGWDYAYLEISSDDGSTWDVLDADGASPKNRLDNSYGPAYTGASRGWKEVDVDLADYTGRKVLLRFHYVTDEALHGTGICLDDINIPQVGIIGDGNSAESWDAQGFRRIENRVPQEYIVQVVEVGGSNVVRELKLDAENKGQLVVPASRNLKEMLVIVAALAPDTRQPADYQLFVSTSSSIPISATLGGEPSGSSLDKPYPHGL